MTPEFEKTLKTVLIDHEGLKLKPYIDTTGHMTIGVGRNLTSVGLRSNEEAIYFLENDLDYFIAFLKNKLKYFNNLDDVRKIALIDLCFNVGAINFMNFREMLEAVETKDYEKAADEILDSRAAKQNPKRYNELAYMMREGVLYDVKGNDAATITVTRNDGSSYSQSARS